MRKTMGSMLAMPRLAFNPMRHSREATKVGSRLGKPGAQEGGQLRDGGPRLHMPCSMMQESSADRWKLQGVRKGGFPPSSFFSFSCVAFSFHSPVSPYSNRPRPSRPFYSSLLPFLVE